MIPTVGRIIHVHSYRLPLRCIAAIVTAVHPSDPPQFDATLFPPHGARGDEASRSYAIPAGSWHDPRECPPTIDGQPVHPDGTVDDRPPQHSPQGDHHVYPSALGTDLAGDETSPVLGDPGRAGE